jgi:hypothetical protein
MEDEMGKAKEGSKPLFRGLSTFEEAFPTVEGATIASYEVGEGVYTSEVPRNAFGTPLPFGSGLIPCSNPYCRRGGYEVDASLDEMRRDKVTEKEFVKHCPGDEGMPRARKTGRRCMNVLHYRLTVKYKPATRKAAAPQ